ncbi:hypothetical protein LQW54_004560 [Pestalotiopsis sp. IQ-011]
MQRLSKEEVDTLEVFASSIANPSYLGAVKQPTLSALPFRRPQEVKDAANFFRNPARAEIARLQKLFATGPSLVYKRHWFPENHKDFGNPELADVLVLGASRYPAWTTNADLERLERARENGTGATGVIRTHRRRTSSLAGRVNFRVTSLTLASLRAKETGSNTNPAPVSGRARLFTAASAPTSFDQIVPCRRFSEMDLQQLRYRVSEDSSLYAKDRFPEDWMVTPGIWNE